MRYDLSKDHEVKECTTRLAYLCEKGKTVDLTEVREKRSISQNSYLHLILKWFGLHFGYTLEESKRLFKEYVNSELFEYEKKGRKFSRSTADLDSKEMTVAIERFRNMSAKQGCYLPEANEHEFLRDVENKLNQTENQMYL